MRKRTKNAKVLLTVAVTCIMLIFILTVKTGKLARIFIPGDPQVTTAAFSNMIADLQEGVSPQEAVTTFCQQILDGANDEEW